MYRLYLFLSKLKKKLKNKLLKFLNKFHFFRKYKKIWDERDLPILRYVKKWNLFKKTWDKRSLIFYDYLKKLMLLFLYLNITVCTSFLYLNILNDAVIILFLFLIFIYFIYFIHFLQFFILILLFIINRIFYKIKIKQSFFKFYDYWIFFKKNYIWETFNRFFLKIFGLKITTYVINFRNFFFINFNYITTLFFLFYCFFLFYNTP